MEIAWAGLFPEYQMLPGPFASQHGAFEGYAGCGPRTGKTSPVLSMTAKLSGLWAGFSPRVSPQNAAPSGVSLASGGSVMLALFPFKAPYESPSERTEPDFSVT